MAFGLDRAIELHAALHRLLPGFGILSFCTEFSVSISGGGEKIAIRRYKVFIGKQKLKTFFKRTKKK